MNKTNYRDKNWKKKYKLIGTKKAYKLAGTKPEKVWTYMDQNHI